MNYNIAVIKGDGVGTEVVDEGIKVLEKIAIKYGHKFNFNYALAGGAAIDATGECLPQKTIDACMSSDSIILGAVGGSKWDNEPPHNRPEAALLGLREKLELFANIRPAKMYKALESACPIKPEIIGDGFDIVVMRELTGDVYFGKKYRDENGVAHDDMNYSVKEVTRIAHCAFKMAELRHKKVTSVDKANVLETSRLWRETVGAVSKEYKHIKLNHMYVDNAAMQLIKNPSQFDVILTGNLFGDILSDEASMITGSIGMLPSASMGEGKIGMYEPIHGSAPDIAGMGKANPIATILSIAMMLKYSFNLTTESSDIENAVETALNNGARTSDIANMSEKVITTSEMGNIICDEL